MTRTDPNPAAVERPSVLIAGGGLAALEAAYALAQTENAAFDVTALAPNTELVLRPMSVAEPFNAGRPERFALAELLGVAGARFIHAVLASVDVPRRTVTLSDGSHLPYDALMIACGATARPAFTHALTFDDARADQLLHGLVQDIEGGYVSSLAIVVPSPPPWPLPAYEIALMACERAWDANLPLRVTVLTPEPAPLAAFGPQASREVQAMLERRGIEVIPFARCEIPEAHTVLVGPEGRRVAAERIIALPALHGPALPGLPETADGFIPVDERGRVRGTERVWAAGDATDYPVRHGGIASQLADTVAADIAAALAGTPPPGPFAPRREAVLLTGGTPWQIGGEGLRPIAGRVPAADKIVARHLGPELQRRRAARSQAPAVSRT